MTMCRRCGPRPTSEFPQQPCNGGRETVPIYRQASGVPRRRNALRRLAQPASTHPPSPLGPSTKTRTSVLTWDYGGGWWGGGVSVQHGALPEPCRLHLCLSDLPCEGQHLRRARLSVLECQLSHRSPGDRTLAGDRAAGC